METIVVNKDSHGIVMIKLNRSEAANALSRALLYELHAILESIKFDRSVRCVILTGSGEKAFCSGADLKERAKMDVREVRQAVVLIRETINKIEELPKPVIAAINGVAYGGGTELALACDIRIAADTATLALTETTLGIIPGAGGTQRLPRLIGKGKAKELIFTGRKVTAKEALEIGLVEHTVTGDKLLDKAFEIGKQIANNAPIAIEQAKLSIDRGFDVDLHTALAIEKAAYEITIPTKDRMEGLLAFKEKRIPKFIGE